MTHFENLRAWWLMCHQTLFSWHTICCSYLMKTAPIGSVQAAFTGGRCLVTNVQWSRRSELNCEEVFQLFFFRHLCFPPSTQLLDLWVQQNLKIILSTSKRGDLCLKLVVTQRFKELIRLKLITPLHRNSSSLKSELKKKRQRERWETHFYVGESKFVSH